MAVKGRLLFCGNSSEQGHQVLGTTGNSSGTTHSWELTPTRIQAATHL